MFITYLLLGSNLGDRVRYLEDAAAAVGQRLGTITARSSLYRTAAWGNHNQPDFINQVVELSTEFMASEVLKGILLIESELGREREERWGSRTIDIDILLFANQIIQQPDLQIPHPFLHERRFCLEPLCEIAPEVLHPRLNKTASELLNDLSDGLFVKKLS